MRMRALASIVLLAWVALAAASDSQAPGTMVGDGFTLTITPVLSHNVGVLEGDGLRLVAQVTRVAVSADVAEPFGVLDAQDKVAFMTLLGDGDARADLAAPWGVVDSADLSEFVRRHESGQP